MSESPESVVSLLGEAADHLDRLAVVCAPAVWTTDIRQNGSAWINFGALPHAIAGHGFTDEVRWMATLSPAVAPFLSGWLRKVASIALSFEDNPRSFEAYVDTKAIELARLVLRGTDSEEVA